MAVVDILAAFTYKWAQLGTAEALTDDQWKVGWSFIGAVPPSVEQFNKWGQVFDEKSNYLYSQLKTVYDLTGVVPGAADANSLRDALRGTGLFTTAAPGTNTTAVATTAFVQAVSAAMTGRLVRTTRFSLPGGVQNVSVDGGADSAVGASTITRRATTKFLRLRVQGAGTGGAGATGATGGNVSLGAPGCSGSYAEALIDAATFGASPVAVVVGAGSAGGVGVASATAGSSSVGALVVAPGGTGAGTLANQVPPTLNGNGTAAAAPTGGNLVSIRGSSPHVAVAQSGTVAIGGSGGASMFGPGGNGPTMNSNGANATNPGSGGSGVVVNSGGGTATGGAGAAGIIIIEEYE